MEAVSITTERGSRISVDKYDSWEPSHGIWLNIALPMASASAVMTKEQAKELATLLLAFAEQ